MKKQFCIFLLLLASVLAFADDVSFQANAPKQVVMGRPFQLSFSVNQRGKDLRAPEMPDFEILAGPYTSQSSSTSFVNGQRTSSFNLTFTYTLMPREEGTFSIQPATINVDGNTYRSNGLKITVLPADQQQQQQQSYGGGAQQQQQRPQAQQQQSASVSGSDIFVKTQVSKTKVHEQECILLSYKLYWAGVDVAQLTNNIKIPEFKGFLKQEIEQGEVQAELEHYNGRNYQTATLYKVLLYPQKPGDIAIEPASFEAVLRVQNRAQVRSIFDDFFASYSNVTKTLNAPGTTIHVASLPAKPAGFSGGVGHFDIKSGITATDITTNDAVTIRFSITGNGNMKLLKTPTVEWPDGFEVYDPKITNNFKATTGGVSGSKDIEFLAIARAAGDYTIPAIRFSYFDVTDGTYKTLSSDEYHIHVARGAGDSSQPVISGATFADKEDIKQLGSDIRYISTSPLQPAGKSAFGLNGLWWLYYLIPLLLSVALFVIFRKKIRENADLTRVRYKKANKVAQKRLKTAKKLLSAGNDSSFYEEIERAAWSYLSDRLSIPTADLTKENIAGILREKGTSEELINEVKNVLSTAEYARYAPSAAGSKQELYDATAKLIDNLENNKL